MLPDKKRVFFVGRSAVPRGQLAEAAQGRKGGFDRGDDGEALPGDQVADSYEHGSKSYAFDGDWKKAKITEDVYMKAFSDADERYARIINLLIAQVKTSGF